MNYLCGMNLRTWLTSFLYSPVPSNDIPPNNLDESSNNSTSPDSVTLNGEQIARANVTQQSATNMYRNNVNIQEEANSVISYEYSAYPTNINPQPQRFLLPSICQSIQSWQTTEKSSIQSVIEKTLKGQPFGSGGDAKVYEIPEYQALVLRVEGEKVDIDLNDLSLVLIKWESAFADNARAGIPVAVLVNNKSFLKAHPQIDRSYLNLYPQQQKIQLWVLRKVSGDPVTKSYSKNVEGLFTLHRSRYYDNCSPELENAIHSSPETPVDQKIELYKKEKQIKTQAKYCRPLDDLTYFYEVNDSNPITGRKAACHLLDQLKSDQPAEILRKHSTELGFKIPRDIEQDKYGEKRSEEEGKKINIGKEFCKEYDQLVKGFLNEMKGIAGMPQAAFDQAVALIKDFQKANVLLDLTNPSNVLIDTTEGQEAFNFVDLCLSTEVSDYIKEHNKCLDTLISDFTAVLFAINSIYFYEIKAPHRLIYREEDFQAFEGYKEVIINKVKTARTGERASTLDTR